MTELTTTGKTNLIPQRDKAEQQRVRAVHAVLMRWVVQGVPVEEILREQPLTLQEFAAQRRVRDVFDANPGTQASIKALDKLILLIDGSEDDGHPKSPVTLIERHIEGPDGGTTTVREVRQSVTLITGEADE